MHTSLGLHHLHKRKRIYQKNEQYPSPNKWHRRMDELIYIAAVFGPLIAIPQILDIWVYQRVDGVSLITWGGFLIGSLFWVAYGFMHKEKPIIVMNLLWVVVYTMIIAGVFVYG
jgi:uncharacterized protein with PQ loop repeat